MNRPVLSIGSLTIGDQPRVVGVITRKESLPALRDETPAACDLVELRLDRIGLYDTDWAASAQQLEEHQRPVIATLRLQAEGGNWTQPEAERRPLLMEALNVCSLLDVEGQSPLLPELAAAAKDKGKALIISYHDFEQTPSSDQMRRWIERACHHHNVIVKIATHVHTQEDIDRLRALLQLRISAPICVIGMGERGMATRIEFPKLGSCLAYGFIDESSAPGQLSCATYRAALTP